MVASAIEHSWTSNEVFPLARAGFWRRASAIAVDGAVIGVLFLVVTILTYGVSGGRVQSAGEMALVGRSECRSLTALPPGIAVPAEFGANYAAECRLSAFGFPISHEVTVGRHTEHEGYSTDVTVAFMLDEQGRVVNLPSLDLLFFPAIILWRWSSDRRKGSFGRRMFGIRLVAAGGDESRAASAGALARRYGLFVFLFAPLSLVLTYQGFNPGFGFFGAMLPVLLGAAFTTAILVLTTAIMIALRHDAIYDRLAGTRVIEVQSAPPLAPAAAPKRVVIAALPLREPDGRETAITTLRLDR